MASTCPLKKLPCKTDTRMYDKFVKDPGVDRLYFCEPPQKLDYFSYFLTRGEHETTFENEDNPDPELPSCHWRLEEEDNNNGDFPCYQDINDKKNDRWPLTAVDCTIALDNAQKEFGDDDIGMQEAMINFADDIWDVEEALLCSLHVLGGPGNNEGSYCDKVNAKCKAQSSGHLFGSFYG
mmetsp:Transcript_3705/g.6782  ORF Transcript_3705/g.6782 Transcript_3705/m.6782 type:complete len:180 (-) Transcript_3705:439-978(-)